MCWLGVGVPNPYVYTVKNDPIRMLRSEFSGLWKYDKTQHALSLVGLGCGALAAAVVLPRYGGPNYQQGIYKV